jgi:hypothetical protein
MDASNVAVPIEYEQALMMAEVDAHKSSNKSFKNVAKKVAPNRGKKVLKGQSTAVKTQKAFVDPATKEMERVLAVELKNAKASAAKQSRLQAIKFSKQEA